MPTDRTFIPCCKSFFAMAPLLKSPLPCLRGGGSGNASPKLTWAHCTSCLIFGVQSCEILILFLKFPLGLLTNQHQVAWKELWYCWPRQICDKHPVHLDKTDPCSSWESSDETDGHPYWSIKAFAKCCLPLGYLQTNSCLTCHKNRTKWLRFTSLHDCLHTWALISYLSDNKYTL